MNHQSPCKCTADPKNPLQMIHQVSVTYLPGNIEHTQTQCLLCGSGWSATREIKEQVDGDSNLEG